MSSEVEEAGGVVAAEPETPPPTPRHGELVAALGEALGADLVSHAYSATEAWVRVAPAGWLQAGRVAKEHLGLSYLCFISGIDWLQNPGLGGEKAWDPDVEASDPPGDGPGRWKTGVAGGGTRFQVFARLADLTRHVGLTLKVDVGDGPSDPDHPGAAPRVASWVPLFRGADWHEREAWEMYGIEFEGHPGLRHLYLPGEFEGFPLRKDFPLLAREVKPWPGFVNVEGLPGDDDSAEDVEA